MKRLASRLATKWKQPYSKTCGYAKIRIAITLVHPTHCCIQGFPSEMIWVPSFFPPSEIRPGALFFSTSCPSPLSVRPFSSSLSINVYSAAALQCMVPPIVCQPASYQPSGSGRPMSSPSFPTQRPICRLAPPSPDLYGWWYLAWVCVCVEGRKETAPRGVLSPSSRRQASPDGRPSACLRLTLDFPLDSCGPQSTRVPRLVR